jgi:hypothetical protein
MPRLFHIATIANDPGVYSAMRASMVAAGFDELSCRFTLFDNSKDNQFEPYRILRQLPGDGDEPYIILCHQDLLFSESCSVDVLTRQIKTLESEHPAWSIAGNAGGDTAGNLVIWLDDPNGSWRSKQVPCTAVSLDENFLLLRRSHYPPVSPQLKGFHFYGTDICLNAILRNHTAHIIRFPVKHLSSGNFYSPEFKAAEQELIKVWKPRLLIGIIRTSCWDLRLSRFALLQWLLRNTILTRILRRMRCCIVPARVQPENTIRASAVDHE